MPKRIMMLGGSYMQMTGTLAAKEQGYYVIDVDYLPDNPAHAVADEYHNVSTIDKEKVLALARDLKIDGILSYASEPAAPTAAYVAEALGLPGNPYESVVLLTQKDRFRTFLRENGFCAPRGCAFTDRKEARAFFRTLDAPVVVKPVDSSGSKGFNKITEETEFDIAWEKAYSFSRCKKVLVEEFIERIGYQIDGDVFVRNGEIAFWGICDQHQDPACSAYVPIGHSCPSTQAPVFQEEARKELQRLFSLLNIRMGAFNFEYIVTAGGKIYFLEVAPRNGGNWITDAIRSATGADLAMYSVRQAVGDPVDTLFQRNAQVCSASYIIHALQSGVFRGISIDPEIEKRIVKQYLSVQPGDPVARFENASGTLGAMILNFDSPEQMCRILDHMNDHFRVIVSDAESPGRK